MRKNIRKFAGIVLCIGMFTGCAQTPDSSLVKPKGSKAVDAYTEADDVSGSKGEASESKNDDGSESKTTIRNLIDAPQNYKSHVEDDSAKLVVNTDASVEIPEVEKISAISVTAAEVTLTVQPKLIIADEPVSALDVSIQAQVLNLLQQLQKDFNLTYLFISHDLSVVEMISDRIGVMYLGTIVETAPKKELYANPRHPYTRALLSAVPIPDPEVKKERITLKGDLPSPSNPPSGCLFHTRCPHCTEKCKTQVPTPVEIAPGHIVKCHYPKLTE